MPFTVPEQVEELMVINKTTSTINLDWAEPKFPHGVITAYEVCYWRLGDNCREPKMLNNTENLKTEIMLKDLGKSKDVCKHYTKITITFC